jgi:hypothetical protein
MLLRYLRNEVARGLGVASVLAGWRDVRDPVESTWTDRTYVEDVVSEQVAGREVAGGCATDCVLVVEHRKGLWPVKRAGW